MSKRNAMQQELALKLPFLRALEAIQLAERAGEQGTPSLLFNLLAEKQPQLALLHLFRAALSRVAQERGVAEDPAGGRGSTAPASTASEEPPSKSTPNPQRRPQVSLFIADDTLTPSTSSPGFSAELVATFVKKALACMGGGTAQPTKVTPLMVLGPGESGKEWWPLMQRIQAAFRGAMCGAPLSSQAPSSSSGMTGHASSPYPPIVDLAWAVYVACANSAVLLTRFWSKEAAAGCYDLPGTLLRALTLDLHTMAHALICTRAFSMGNMHHVIDTMDAITPVILGLTSPADLMPAPQAPKPLTATSPSTNEGTTSAAAGTHTSKPAGKTKRQAQGKAQVVDDSHQAAGAAGGGQATADNTAYADSRQAARIQHALDHRGLVAGALLACRRSVPYGRYRSSVEGGPFQAVPLLLATRLLIPLHASLPRPITDPAPQLRLPCSGSGSAAVEGGRGHSAYTSGGNSSAVSSPNSSRNSSSGGSSASITTVVSTSSAGETCTSRLATVPATASASGGGNSIACPAYMPCSMWAPSTFGLGPANAAMAGVAVLRFSLFNNPTPQVPSTYDLVSCAAFSSALSAVGHAMMKEASEPGFVDRMAADLGAITSSACMCASMSDAAEAQLVFLARMLGLYSRVEQGAWMGEGVQLQRVKATAVLLGPVGGGHLTRLCTELMLLSHTALVCTRILGQLVQVPGIAAGLTHAGDRAATPNAPSGISAGSNITGSTASLPAGGSMCAHQAVVGATVMGSSMYSMLISLTSGILGLTQVMQGSEPTTSADGAEQKLYTSHTLSLLPPHFGRCCLSVCSWAGGLHALWPLVTTSLDLLESPTCFTPNHPVAFSWLPGSPAKYVTAIVEHLSMLPCSLFHLLNRVHSDSTPAARGGSKSEGNLTAWLGCLTAAGSQHKRHPKDPAPPPCVPPQALVYRLSGLPAGEWEDFLFNRHWDPDQLLHDILPLDALLQMIVPLSNLVHVTSQTKGLML